MSWLQLLSCVGGVVCGPGTVQVDGTCLPEATDVGTTDSGSGSTDGGSTDGGSTDGGSTDGGSTDGGSTDGGADGGGSDTGVADPPVQVYLLAGQSNMVGIGQVTALPESLRVAQDDIGMYCSLTPGWRALDTACSAGPSWIGPEVSFGRTLADALPDVEVRLVKHAVGGTDLYDYWDPGETPDDTAGEGYRVFRETVQAALADLDAEGRSYQVAGMIWMQGESDATQPHMAGAYQANLTQLIDRVREDVATPDLPFVAGLIDCTGVCTYRAAVRTAQQAVADADPLVDVIETQDLGLHPTDAWHYQGIGQRVMGERFARVLLGEEAPAMPTAAVELTGSYSYSYFGTYNVGWRMSVRQAIQLTDVGIFDLGDDGLAHSADLAIWEHDTESLLAIETVPAWDVADTTLLGGFRLAAIEPLVLEPGDYVIANQSFATDFDYYVYNADISSSDSVLWVEGRHATGTSLSFPDIVGGSDESTATWFGPNFLYRVVE